MKKLVIETNITPKHLKYLRLNDTIYGSELNLKHPVKTAFCLSFYPAIRQQYFLDSCQLSGMFPCITISSRLLVSTSAVDLKIHVPVPASQKFSELDPMQKALKKGSFII